MFEINILRIINGLLESRNLFFFVMFMYYWKCNVDMSGEKRGETRQKCSQPFVIFFSTLSSSYFKLFWLIHIHRRPLPGTGSCPRNGYSSQLLIRDGYVSLFWSVWTYIISLPMKKFPGRGIWTRTHLCVCGRAIWLFNIFTASIKRVQFKKLKKVFQPWRHKYFWVVLPSNAKTIWKQFTVWRALKSCGISNFQVKSHIFKQDSMHVKG